MKVVIFIGYADDLPFLQELLFVWKGTFNIRHREGLVVRCPGRGVPSPLKNFHFWKRAEMENGAIFDTF